MTKIIAFISRKGGTGKTTNAINIATCLFSLGHKVCLIETDTNYTLSTLRKMEEFKSKGAVGKLFPIKGSTDEKAVDDIKALQKENFDFILVDSAGKTTTDAIKQLALSSDAIVVPSSLTQNDLLVTFQTVEDLKWAKDHKESLKLLVLPNRIHSSTKMKSIHSQMENLDATVIDTFVPSKNAFAQFSTIRPEKGYFDVAEKIMAILK